MSQSVSFWILLWFLFLSLSFTSVLFACSFLPLPFPLSFLSSLSPSFGLSLCFYNLALISVPPSQLRHLFCCSVCNNAFWILAASSRLHTFISREDGKFNSVNFGRTMAPLGSKVKWIPNYEPLLGFCST